MTTYPTLKIVKGARSIDLNDRVNVYLRTDFVPPETAHATQIAQGSALNMSGGRVVARKPQTRTWTFSVRVVGSTEAEITSTVRGIKTLLSMAGDAAEPVTVQYKPNSNTPAPRWGQFGAPVTYEVLDAGLVVATDFMRGDRRAKAVQISISLTIQPYAVGAQQRLMSALGGIVEDRLGVLDGRARGVQIPEATTNLCTNPVFGNATYDTGWTTGANVVAAKNTDARYVAYGYASARLTALAATNNTFTQSLTLAASTHVLSVMVKRPDSAAVTNADVQITYNGTDRTTTFTAIGDGWYMAEASVTGTGGAAACGVTIKALRTIYLGAMQAEAKAYRTPMCYGDLLGCTWSGTAHASTSVRTAARLRISTAADTVRTGPFAVRLVWTAGAAVANNMTLLDVRDGTHTTGPQIYISGAQFNCIYSGFIVGHATAVAANTTYVLHLVFDGATFELYVNGVASGNASTPTTLGALGAYLYIGTDYSAANHCNGTIGGVALWDVALTASEIAADHANAAAAIADGARVEAVPWLWTKDGDNVVDNCNDSTRDNWCVVGGVGGNAQTPIRLHATPTALEPNGVWLVNNHAPVFVKPDPLFIDYNTNADASCSGNGYGSGAINTTGSNIATSTLSQTDYKYLLAGKDAIVFARVEVSAGTLSLKTRILSGSTVLYESDWITTSAGAVVFQLFKTYPIRALDAQNDAIGIAGNPQIQLLGKASTGTPTVNIDYACVMAGDFVEYLAKHSASSKMVIFENKAICTDSSDLFTENMPTTGRVPLSVYPNEFNILMLQMGYVGGSNTVADTFTIGAMYVTPKHDLL